MIIDLIDKLIDRCIQLVQEHKKVQRSLFDDYVVPIFSQFELVHKQYLEDFKKYARTIESGGGSAILTILQLCDTIQEDNLFTADQRIRLKQLSKMKDEKIVGTFILNISNYLNTGTIEIHGEEKARLGDPLSQRWRTGLIIHLKEIANKESLNDEGKKAEARERLKELVGDMQRMYSEVVSSYAGLKKDLSS